MTGKTSFSRHFIEAAVIVFSILFAFVVDAWWQNREERKEEVTLLTGLRNEIEINLENGKRNRLGNSDLISKLEIFSQMTPEEIGELESGSFFTEIYTPMIRQFALPSSNGFLEATISSGKLGIIQDPFLRSEIARLNGLGDDEQALSQVLDVFGIDAMSLLGKYVVFVDGELLPFPNHEGFFLAGSDVEIRGIANGKISALQGHSIKLNELTTYMTNLLNSIDSRI